MVVTTAIAMIAAFVLVYVAIDRTRAQEQAETERKMAVQKQKEMKKQLEELQANVAGIERDLSALDATTDKLVKQLADANTQAQRDEIAKEIARNNEQKRKLREKQREADELRKKIERGQKIRVDEKCQTNALC
jgi:predicted RNase H-like nuclease (RuvC/YqgF family)